MKFNKMNKMNFKDWNGDSFEAYYTNNCNVHCDNFTTKIIGYVRGKWITDKGVEWLYVYPVENNKPKRMTNRQLAMWLAKGNGEWTTSGIVHRIDYPYDKDYANEFVAENIRIRKWDSEEWIEPTIDLL